MYGVPAVPEREMCKSAMHIFLCLIAHLRGSYFYYKNIFYLSYFKMCKMPLFGRFRFVLGFFCLRVFSYIVKFFVYCIPVFLLLT